MNETETIELENKKLDLKIKKEEKDLEIKNKKVDLQIKKEDIKHKNRLKELEIELKIEEINLKKLEVLNKKNEALLKFEEYKSKSINNDHLTKMNEFDERILKALSLRHKLSLFKELSLHLSSAKDLDSVLKVNTMLNGPLSQEETDVIKIGTNSILEHMYNYNMQIN